MKLNVLGRYTNSARNIDVYPGDEIEVKDELAAWLMNDAPGCFEDPAKPPDEQTAPGQEPSDEARRQSAAILDEAQRLLVDAHAEADHTRATALDTGAQKPFDMPPDGTTLKTDAAPSVITGPDSGVEVTHRAAADEQQAVVQEQQAINEEQQAAEPADVDISFTPSSAFEAQLQEDEDEEQKGLDAPPRDKAVKRSPKQK